MCDSVAKGVYYTLILGALESNAYTIKVIVATISYLLAD